MSVPLILAGLWVLAAVVVAVLPLKRQYAPGLVLLLAAPVLIVSIAIHDGLLLAGFAVFGFVSMFRRPLWHLFRRAVGHA